MTSVFQSMTWRINLWKQIHVYNGDSFHERLWWLCKFPFSFNLFEKISNLEFQNIIWIKIGKFFHNLLHRYVNTYGNKMIEHLRSSQNPTEISKKNPYLRTRDSQFITFCVRHFCSPMDFYILGTHWPRDPYVEWDNIIVWTPCLSERGSS